MKEYPVYSCFFLSALLEEKFHATQEKTDGEGVPVDSTEMIAKASLSSLTGAQPTRDMTGFSSSLSMGIEVEWTHVDVQRWRSRTYEF